MKESMIKAGIKAGLIFERKRSIDMRYIRITGNLEPGVVHVCVRLEHAESLTRMVEGYKKMIALVHDDDRYDKKGSKKFLTAAYCDELIEALTVKKGSKDGDGFKNVESAT